MPEQAARREAREETGLEMINPRFVAITNNIFSNQNHSIYLYFEAECANSDELKNLEAKNCQNWAWKDWNEVSKNWYLPLKLLKESDYRPFLADKNSRQTKIEKNNCIFMGL